MMPFFTHAQERKEPNKGMLESNLLSLSYGRIVPKDINTDEGLLPESFESYQIVHPDDIVFRLTDLQNDKRSLRSAICKELGIITSAYLVVSTQGLDSNYLNYLMRSYDVMKVFYSMGGGMRQSMKFDDIKRLPLIVPTTLEQSAIADFLDQGTSRIDTLISEQNRLIEIVTEKILAMVTNSFVRHDIKWIRLQHVCETISRPLNQQDNESYTRLGLYNRGRGAFKKDGADYEDLGDSDFFWIQEGDLIISGQFAWEGAVALATKDHSGCVVSHRFPVIRGCKDEVLTEYLLALLMTHYGDFILNECSRGSAGRNRPLNINALLKWKIPIPPIVYQQKISLLVGLRERIRKNIDRSVNLLKEFCQSLISAAVTGKIDVREVFPSELKIRGNAHE